MSKKNKYCFGCDAEFTVSCRGRSDVQYCPFCGAEVVEEDETIYEEDEDDL